MEGFRDRGLHFIHLSIDSLLSEIKELCHILKTTTVAVKGISKSKADASVLQLDISIDNNSVL